MTTRISASRPDSLNDLELCARLGEHHHGYMRRFGSLVRYPTKDTYEPNMNDPFTVIAFPFLIKMDRISISSKTSKQINDEINEVESKMFVELERHFPVPSNFNRGILTLPCDHMGLIHHKIRPYQQIAYEQKKAKKAAEEAKIEYERILCQIKHAIVELGRIREIGKGCYIVKNREVFEVTNSRAEDSIDLHIIKIISNSEDIMSNSNSVIISRWCRIEPTTAPSTERIAYMRGKLAAIARMRGRRMFASEEDAVAHWDAIEETKIIAEARRRLAEEERLAKEAADAELREIKILVAMNKLRSQQTKS
jgi:hypothetical protein